MHNDDYHQVYIELIDHPHALEDCVSKSIRIHELIPDYDGPGIAIDFNKANRAIGIEILYSYEEDDDSDE